MDDLEFIRRHSSARPTCPHNDLAQEALRKLRKPHQNLGTEQAENAPPPHGNGRKGKGGGRGGPGAAATETPERCAAVGGIFLPRREMV